MTNKEHGTLISLGLMATFGLGVVLGVGIGWLEAGLYVYYLISNLHV